MPLLMNTLSRMMSWAAGLLGVNWMVMALPPDKFWNLQFSMIRVAPPITLMNGAPALPSPSKVRLRRMTICELEPLRVPPAMPPSAMTPPGQSTVSETLNPVLKTPLPPSMQATTCPGSVVLIAVVSEQGTAGEQEVPVPVGEA
jgi:hypothetical protein